MITHLHVKSRDNSSNGIAVIGQTIFVENWLWRPSCFSEIAENQYQPSLCHLISVLKVWWWYIHNFSFNWSDVVKILSQQKIGCGGHLVFQKLLKINTSQAYATLYPYKTYGGDIFITFPLIGHVVNILSQQKIGCGGHLVFQKLLKINTSQAYATLFPYTTFGEDKFITFPLIDRTSSIFWVSKKLAVAAILFFKNCWKSIPAKLMPPYIHIKHMVVIYS